jgi:hypothetical protein
VLSLAGTAIVRVEGGSVRAAGTGQTAVSVSGASRVDVIGSGVISVAGGVTRSGTASLTPAALTGQPVPTDPFVGVVVPVPAGPAPVVSCTFSAAARSCTGTGAPVPTMSGTTASIPAANYLAISVAGGVVSLGPGRYGSITVSGTGAVVLRAGVYVFNGAGLILGGATTLTGTGVQLVFGCAAACPAVGAAGSRVDLSGTAALTMSAPSGSAFVVAADRANTAGWSVAGSAAVRVTGSVYARSTAISLTGTGLLSVATGSLAVGSVVLAGSARMTVVK